MPKPKKVDLLPQEIKRDLEAKLVEHGFADYVELSDWLAEQGYEISKSALHRYGTEFKEQLDKMQVVAHQTKAIIEAFPDDEDITAQALSRLSQTQMFNLLQGINIDVVAQDLKYGDNSVDKYTKLLGAMTKLNQGSLNLKKYVAEIKTKAKSVADEVSSTMIKGGLSDTTVDEIRYRILGIAS
jgi:cell fate (sporulation/competence/biofilm development) regulator YlbF (YheA/YmcA/DUF963 family)